jgi:hypothetical protein
MCSKGWNTKFAQIFVFEHSALHLIPSQFPSSSTFFGVIIVIIAIPIAHFQPPITSTSQPSILQVMHQSVYELFIPF